MHALSNNCRTYLRPTWVTIYACERSRSPVRTPDDLSASSLKDKYTRLAALTVQLRSVLKRLLVWTFLEFFQCLLTKIAGARSGRKIEKTLSYVLRWKKKTRSQQLQTLSVARGPAWTPKPDSLNMSAEKFEASPRSRPYVVVTYHLLVAAHEYHGRNFPECGKKLSPQHSHPASIKSFATN